MNPEEGNVFSSASKTMVDQAIASVLDKSSAKPNDPTAAQVSNREVDDDSFDVSEAPIIPDNASSTGEYEEAILNDSSIDEFNKELEDAQAIDNQLSLCINTLRKLFKVNYHISSEVREDAITELTNILDKLKA